MATRAAREALARNQLSSALALALADALSSDAHAHDRFVAQLPALLASFSSLNVFALVADGKALTKVHSAVLQLLEDRSSPALQCAGFRLAALIASQSPLEPLEKFAPTVLDRAVRILKRNSTDEAVAVAACQAAAAVAQTVDQFQGDTRRELLDAVGKLVPALLTSRENPSSEFQTEALRVTIALLDACPTALRSFATKLETASIALLFGSSDGEYEAAIDCLVRLPAASDQPQLTWTHMTRKALAAIHLQLDVLGATAAATSSDDSPPNLKLWTRSAVAISTDLPVYQRAATTAHAFARSATVIKQLAASRVVSDREVVAVLPDVVSAMRRALATRALEVGKQTGVSADGVALPVSAAFAVLPIVHAAALQSLGASVHRAGTGALRRGSQIGRTLLLAVETLRVGAADRTALFEAVSLCVSALGASAVDRVGVPLLDELVSLANEDLDEPVEAAVPVAVSSRGGDKKGKKRKRQNGPDISALAATQAAPFVAAQEREIRSKNVAAALGAVSTCVGVYGRLLPAPSRRAASELVLRAARLQTQASSQTDAVVLALLTDAVTGDAASSHGRNVLEGLTFWRRAVRYGPAAGASLLLPLAALNAGEALLHPRGPPLELAEASEETVVKSKKPFGRTTSMLRGNADDWHGNEAEASDNDADDNAGDDVIDSAGDEKMNTEEVKTETPATVDDVEEEEDDYDDERPAKAVKAEEAPAVEESSEDEGPSKPAAPVVATVEPTKPTADDDADEDDEFPDIVMDDEDED